MSSLVSLLEEDGGHPADDPLEVLGVQTGLLLECEWRLGRMNDPVGLLCTWLVSDGVRRAEPWLFGGRYWSNSWTSNPSMLPMTSVLSSEMSTLLKSMFWRLEGGAEPSPPRWVSCLVPKGASVFGVVGGVGGP